MSPALLATKLPIPLILWPSLSETRLEPPHSEVEEPIPLPDGSQKDRLLSWSWLPSISDCVLGGFIGGAGQVSAGYTIVVRSLDFCSHPFPLGGPGVTEAASTQSSSSNRSNRPPTKVLTLLMGLWDKVSAVVIESKK
jgi:hypothetical protein